MAIKTLQGGYLSIAKYGKKGEYLGSTIIGKDEEFDTALISAEKLQELIANGQVEDEKKKKAEDKTQPFVNE